MEAANAALSFARHMAQNTQMNHIEHKKFPEL
jgi:hypothetical protein